MKQTTVVVGLSIFLLVVLSGGALLVHAQVDAALSQRALLPIVMHSGPACTPVPTTDPGNMVLVPAGAFIMGSTTSDPDADDREFPQHTVSLDAFWIDRTEVTNGEYQECVAAGACDPPDSTKSFTRDNYYGNPTFDDYPVIYVTWYNAEDYCNWAGKRLPTEAEWEKAARGTDGRRFPWGDDPIDATRANYDWNVRDTTEVGSYPSGASPYGALDMMGNVREWVADWYDEDYYSVSPSTNPLGPTSSSSKVMRGGSWNTNIWYTRSAGREHDWPTEAYSSYGIRCARSQ